LVSGRSQTYSVLKNPPACFSLALAYAIIALISACIPFVLHYFSSDVFDDYYVVGGRQTHRR